MPTKLGNGGKGPETYDPQTGRYTDDGNVSSEEKKAMGLMRLVYDNLNIQVLHMHT